MARYRTAFITVAVLSAALNVLLLGGSLYMMLVYDSVIPSHSLPTLFGLLGMLLVVYVFQGMFDTMRARILSDVAAGFDQQMAPRVQQATSEAMLMGARSRADGLSVMRDLDQVRGFLSSTGPAALIDLPWILFFLAILFLLHVWLGLVATIGALVLIVLTILTDRKTKKPIGEASQLASLRSGMAESNLRHVEVLTALGMRGRMLDRWNAVNAHHMHAQNQMSRVVGVMSGTSKLFRMLLQSLILTVGALLVINGQASGGVIFASSILSGRALAPVDSAIANWRSFSAARIGWARLNEFLARVPASRSFMTLLPPPSRSLGVDSVAIAPPGTQRVTVSHAHFMLEAGSGLGIIGPSAAGKTSLGRAIIGLWKPARGSIRLDGTTYDQWDTDTLGASFGYLPQSVELLEGTVAENIARFEPEPDSDAIIAAAQSAGVHNLIVQLPQGYETQVGSDGSQLSAGQRQRIGLARALYRDPFLVLLDEPNSNLDGAGEAALEGAIRSVRERGGIAIVIAHRPSVLAQVDLVLVMRDGRMEAFGPRDEVLAKVMAKPHASVQQTSEPTSAALGTA